MGSMGPAEVVQAAAIARRFYFDGKSKMEIGAEYGLSRYKVARILDNCLESGLVRIEINTDAAIDADLSERLRRAYGLRRALVATGSFTDFDGLRHGLGRVAADLLSEVVTESDVLGVGWGRTLDAMAQHVRDLPACTIVQMSGVVGDVQASSVDLVRQLTSVSRGPQYPIYAPLIMSDQRMKAALARQPGVATAMDLWKRITVAVVAVGSLDLTGSQVYAMLSDQGRAELDSLNVAAELCAIQFDAAGRPVRTNYSGRTLAISYRELSAVDEVIAIAGGHQKVEAIRASLISGVVTSLVTDRETAISLLRVAPSESADRA